MKLRNVKILLLIIIFGFAFVPVAYAQVDQFEYERPSLNPLFVYGNGEAGYVDGTLADARFNHPMGAFYTGEVILVADTYNRRVRVVQLENDKVETIECAADSKASCSAEFVFPVDVSCGPDEFCWVLDAGDGSITRIEWNESFAITGRYMPQQEGQPLFKGALGLVAADSTLLYIANTYDNRVWSYDVGSDSAAPLVGTGEAGYDEKEMDAILTPLNHPTSLVNIQTSIMILDSRNSTIREGYYNDQSKWISSVFSGGGPFPYLTRESDLGQVYDFGLPFRMTYTSFNPGLFYISIPGRNQVVCLTFERQAYIVAGEGAKNPAAAGLGKPYAIAAQGNRLAVFDGDNYLRIYSIKREAKE